MQSSKADIRTSLGTLTHKITALAKADMQIQHQSATLHITPLMHLTSESSLFLMEGLTG